MVGRGEEEDFVDIGVRRRSTGAMYIDRCTPLILTRTTTLWTA